MEEWQPIETAPRDGTSVLLFDGEIHEGFWDEVDFNEFSGTPVMSWNYGNLSWIDDTNFWPTHWMPLPSPPSA
jgi:hypothetical protein